MAFNEKAKELIKLIYGTLDMDFALKETEELYKREYGQTFDNYKASSEYLYEMLKREGFDAELYTFPADGKTVYQDKRTPLAWNATKGKLTVLSSPIAFDEPVVADFEKMPYALIKHSVSTPEGGIKARLLTAEEVEAGADPTGALVLVDTRPSFPKYLDMGAIGLVSCYINNPERFPDCTYWANAAADDSGHWHVQSEDRDFIGYMVTPRVGKKLKEACEAGEVTVLLESDGRRYVGEINGVTATLKGKTNKEFWLLGHLYEPNASDNSMGIAGSIALLKAIRTLVEKGVLPEPECTIRVVFALELYGFAAMYEALGTEITDNVLGAIDVDALPEVDKNTYIMTYPPYSSPFFASSFMKSAMELYDEIYPNTERVELEMIQFTDDCFLGDSTTKVPTIWAMYGIECGYETQHNSSVDMSYIEPKKFARSLSIVGFVALASVARVIPIEDMLDNALYHSEKLLKKKAQENRGEGYMSFFRLGERAEILDFKKISDSPLIDEYAAKIDGTYVEFSDTGMGEHQKLAKTIIPKRELKGLPFDRVRAPKGKRLLLPDRVIYGPFGLVLSAMDGKKNLERIIREALWEAGEPVSDATFREHIEAIKFLAEYGYISIKEYEV